MDEKLVDKEYLLEKLPGKYGWTYTIIPEIRPDPNAPFNWVKVRGTIDNYQIKGYRLMPSGDVMPSGKGVLFLAVNAEIRKKIQKQAGDYVHIVLYPDNEPIEIPKEFLLCLQDDIVALQFLIRSLKANNTNTSGGYIRQRENRPELTGLPKQ